MKDKFETGLEVAGGFDQEFKKPAWFNQRLFDEGRQFMHKYELACGISSLTSLILGLSFERLLNVLVFTNFSETKQKSFWRYFDTARHVDSWFSTDIFETGSAGNKSLKRIRQVHKVVRNRAHAHFDDEKTYLSQTDLAHTLIGFVGPILGSPELFGVAPEDRQMDGFVHMWRVFGYLHGIEDDFNPFEADDTIKTRATVFKVFEECLIPSLHQPPEMFLPMSGAICAWAGPLNSFWSFLSDGINKFRVGTVEYGVKVQFAEKTNAMLDEVEIMYERRSFREHVNYYWLVFLFTSYQYPLGRWLLNGMHRNAIKLLLLKRRPDGTKLK